MTTSLGPALSIERPFAGLRPFGFFDHEFFFGREDQVYSLYRLLDRSRFVAVVGSSGSGKSSLVSAGLLPLLDEESKSRGARRWRYIQFRPGYAPLRRLADELVNLSPVTDDRESRTNYEIRRERIGAALAQSSLGFSEAINEIDTLRDHSLLVVVDQFEELFRYSNLNFDEFVTSVTKHAGVKKRPILSSCSSRPFAHRPVVHACLLPCVQTSSEIAHAFTGFRRP